jgi:hypothetical protein
MAKRRYISQLPAVLQTQTLQQFFSSTVDQLFQPGVTESMNALIGKKPSYFNVLRDFYKAESSKERQFYQLEPAMTAKADSVTEYSDLLFYQDLVNSLRFQGADVSNHSRLFESEMYSWCPPIDVNKLVNYRDYYWMPDGPPVLVLEVPSVGGVVSYVGDGVKSRFTIPREVIEQRENVVVRINGQRLSNEQFNKVGDEVILVQYDNQSGQDVEVPLPEGDVIRIWRNGDYLGNGTKTAFKLPALIPDAAVDVTATINGIQALTSTYNVVGDKLVFNTPPTAGATIQIWGNSYFKQNIVGKNSYTHTIPGKGYAKQSQQNEFTGRYEVIKFPEIIIDTPPPLERFFRIEIRDNTGATLYQVNRTEDEKLTLGKVDKLIKRIEPLHTVIEKQSPVNSPWSRSNHWYHTDSVFYFYDNYKPQRATRPIIEFMGDVRLWKYGLNRLDDVNDIVATIKEDPWLYDRWTSFAPGAIYNSPAVHIDGVMQPLPTGRVMFRSNSTDGNRTAIEDQILNLVLRSTVTNLPEEVLAYDSELITFAEVSSTSLGKYVGEESTEAVWSNYDNDGWDGEFTLRVSQPDITRKWDIFKMVDSFAEYYYEGQEWVSAQEFKFPYEPLFELYDDNSIKRSDIETKAFSDLTAYPGSDFQGNKIFAFKRGTGKNDAVLGFPLSRNKFGNLDFEDRTNDKITHDGGEVKGFKYFAHMTLDYDVVDIDLENTDIDLWQATFDAQRNFTNRYANNWLYAGNSNQTIAEEGFYNIPLSLQANPRNEQISTISLNDWNQHFKPVVSSNNWKSVSVNRDLSLGRSILQHRSPLLRTMFVNSNSNVDFMKAVIYNEREYVRYMNKFVQSLKRTATNMNVDDTAEILDRLLHVIRVSKTSDFPFTNSGMAGGDWYIPVSGAAIGAVPAWKPEIIIETSKVADLQTTMIRGHDGSLTAGFTKGTSAEPIEVGEYDSRDLVLLALETKIYDNLESEFRARRRPSHDVMSQIPGKFRQGDYSRDEYIKICRPLFERWCAQNQLNYRENKFRNDNAWTYNYSKVGAADGSVIPGNWRGIYRYYFDTDRPDTHPWEMLGFTTKPSNWDAMYSWTDATKREALIQAIEVGLVDTVKDVRDPIFARAGFRDVCPVDESGGLLDPIQAKIVGTFGIHRFESPWEFGDGSPIEIQWWNSYYGSFTLSQLGYLMKPVRFIESNWLANDEMLVHDHQWVSPRTGWREQTNTEIVHNELVNGVLVKKMGVQTWISDYLRSQGKAVTGLLGDHIRTLHVNLAHKLGGFIEPRSLKAFTETTGLIPQEDVLLALYRSPSVREEFYGGVITEWTGRGWRLLGYDIVDPVFKIKPVVPTGRRARVALSEDLNTTLDWRADTYYTVNVRVHHEGTNYVCAKTHTSGKEFEPEFWTAESVGRIDNALALTWYSEHEEEIVRIPYGTVLQTRQEVADFLSGYQAYLETRGWSFENYDYEINETLDFKYSLREFMYWTETRWVEGSFISLSPSSEMVKFVTKHGTVQNVDQLVNGAYSLVDRAGLSIPPNKITTNRLDDVITVKPYGGNGIFGLRVYISEVEHALVFNNQTIFDDVIYDPLFNLRQSRLRVLASISQDWVGRLDAPGFVITDNALMPSFEQQVQDIRYMYDVEKAINLPLRTNARHQIGYQSRDYLEGLMFNDTNQFEFYQGMIQQKGAPGVFNKLLRNDGLTASKQLSFLEEWAFRKGEYGGTEKFEKFEFILNKYQIKAEPQQIEFISNNSGYDILTYENTGAPIELHWDSMTQEGLESLDTEEDTVIQIYDYMGLYDRRWIAPKKAAAFDQIDDFMRSKQALPSAGYARLKETKFQDLSIPAFNKQIVTASEDLELTDRVWIYKDENNNWDVYRASLPHKSIDIVINGSDVTSFDELDSALNVIPFGTVSDGIVYYKINMAALPTGLVVGKIVEILNNKSPALGLSGMYEVKAIDGNAFLVTHKSVEVVGYEPTLEGTLVSMDVPVKLIVGDKVYLSREINKNEKIGGIHTVVDLGPTPYSVILDVACEADFEYQLKDEKPRMFKMASVRISTNDKTKDNRVNSLDGSDLTEINNVVPLDQFKAGEFLYVDVCYDFGYQYELHAHKRRWSVYQWNGTGFSVARRQPPKIKRDMIRDVRLFETLSIRTAETLNAKPLVNTDILILDPSQGLVPGVAQKEVAFKLEYDPASYNTGPEGDKGLEWGAKEVGKLWWDLSTTRYLINETDEIIAVQDRDLAEIEYRSSTWGQLAPGSSVDIYEWTKSSLTPQEWQAEYELEEHDPHIDGDVYLPDDSSYVTSEEWDERLGKYVAVYYFWVKNRLYSPANTAFRKMSGHRVSEILSNPLGQSIAWIAPISMNSLITSGITQYLTRTTSMQLTVARTAGESVRHVEWQLMRKGDERSLPDADLWTKLTQSLAARDIWGVQIPDMRRYYTDRIGFDVHHGQNLFRDIKSARRHLVDYLNGIFSKTLIVDERRDLIVLNDSEGKKPELVWAQAHDSYYIKPIPHVKLWSGLVDTLNRPEEPIKFFWESELDYTVRLIKWRYENNSAINTTVPFQYEKDVFALLRNLKMGEAYWSVMDVERWDNFAGDEPWGSIYDADQVENPLEPNGPTNPWTGPGFEWDIAKAAMMWHHEVDTFQERDALMPAEPGTRVKIRGNESTGGFWTLWEYNGSSWNFLQNQRYNSQDAWEFVDWYEEGVSPLDPPQYRYPTIAVRDQTILQSDGFIKFVLIENDGKGRWMWTALRNGVWEVVAKQNGTFKLKDSIWKNTGNFYDDSVLDFENMADKVTSRDLGYELDYILNALRDEIFTDEELNGFFFSMIEHAHTEQDYIDWAFKTSYMNVTGYGDRLTQSPIAYADLTHNLLEYIKEVKPYHVKVRDYISKYRIATDVANTHATDYDKPVYVDRNTGEKRVLSPYNPADIVILNRGKFIHWYDQWRLYDQGENDNMPLVRKIKVTSAYLDEAKIHVTGSIRIRVMRKGDAGGAMIEGGVAQGYENSGLLLDLENPAQNRTSTPVFADGLRVDPDLVQYVAVTSSVSIAPQYVENKNYDYTSFGYGAKGPLREVKYFHKLIGTQVFNLEFPLATSAHLQVTLDGEELLPEIDFTITNGIMSVTNSMAGFLAVAMIDNANDVFDDIRAFSFKGGSLVGKTFLELYPELGNTARHPISQNFIIERDGYRIQPEWTYNINVHSMNNQLMLDRDGPVEDLIARFNGVIEPIANKLWKKYVLPAATRSVELLASSTLDNMTILDYQTGLPIVVGVIVNDSDSSDPDLDPDNPEYNGLAPWEGIDQVTWDTWDENYESEGTQFEYQVSPANAEYVLHKGHIISLTAMNADRELYISVDNYVPESFEGWNWGDANEEKLVKINHILAWVGGTFGRLCVTDRNGDFEIEDVILDKFPGTQMITVTDFKHAENMGIHSHSWRPNEFTTFPVSALGPNKYSYWVNLNGKRLINGVDYEVIDYPYAYDEFSFDTEGWSPTEYYLHGMVAGQYLGGYDGYRNYAMTNATATELVPGHRFRSRRFDFFDWDHHVVAVKLLNYVENEDDIIIATVFSEEQATFGEEYELFVRNSESKNPTVQDMSDDWMTKINLKDTYYLLDEVTIDSDLIRMKKIVSPFYRDVELTGPGKIWVGKELVTYQDAVYDPSTQITTITGINRGAEITTRDQHAIGERCVVTSFMYPQYVPL